MAESFIPYTEQEEDALEALWDHRAEALYRRLRRSMDWRTRTVGRVMPISLGGLRIRLKQCTTRGKGFQEHPCSEDMVRSSIQKLIKAGLLARIGNDEALCFLCPLAKDASARIAQTPHVPPTHLSTERPTVKASRGAGFRSNHPSLKNRQSGPNAPHIEMSDVYTPQSSSTDSTGVVPPGDERGGVSRDRAAPSQDGSLGRPVDTPEDLYRDRPLGASQAGPLERPSHNGNDSHRDRAAPSEVRGPAQQPVPSNSQGRGDPPVLSAENESAPLGVSAGADDPEQALREVLRVHAVRVLPKDAPGLAEWVRMRVLPAELAEVVKIAIGLRLADGSMQRLNVGYLHSILLTQRSDARKAAQGAKTQKSMRYSQSGLIALAAQLGIPPARAGEEPEAFRIRVMTAHAARGAEGG